MLRSPFRLNGAEVTSDEIKAIAQTYFESYPAQQTSRTSIGIAVALENDGIYFYNTDTTTDMTDQNVVTVPLYIDVYDDYNALVNKTTYGSRRIDNFYFNFTDIKVISEDGDAKTAAAERFRAYIDYYFTAGTGNYGYYEDLWYDDGHLVSFVDFTGLNGTYASAHYTVSDSADAYTTVTGTDSVFAKFIDGSKYYATDGTTADNEKYLQVTWNSMVDRSYIKIIGGRNIGGYYMLGLNQTNTANYGIGYDENGFLTSAGTTDLRLYSNVYFTIDDVLSRTFNGLQNIATATGNNRLENY